MVGKNRPFFIHRCILRVRRRITIVLRADPTQVCRPRRCRVILARDTRLCCDGSLDRGSAPRRPNAAQVGAHGPERPCHQGMLKTGMGDAGGPDMGERQGGRVARRLGKAVREGQGEVTAWDGRVCGPRTTRPSCCATWLRQRQSGVRQRPGGQQAAAASHDRHNDEPSRAEPRPVTGGVQRDRGGRILPTAPRYERSNAWCAEPRPCPRNASAAPPSSPTRAAVWAVPET